MRSAESVASKAPGNTLYLRLVLMAFCSALAGLVLYPSDIADVAGAVIRREEGSHGIFVLFFVVLFVWMRRDKIFEAIPRTDYLGIPFLAIGFLLSFLDWGGYRIEVLSFLLFVAGLIILLLGRKFFVAIIFPYFFLVTVIPLPSEIYRSIAEHIRTITLTGTVRVASGLKLAFLRDGNYIHLPNTLLDVSIGCSGIRYLVSYFVFGLAYAYIYRSSTWSRVAVVASTIPISIMASISRLTTILFAAYFIDPRMAELGPHILISWSVFLTILVLAISLDRHFHGKYLRKRQVPKFVDAPDSQAY